MDNRYVAVLDIMGFSAMLENNEHKELKLVFEKLYYNLDRTKQMVIESAKEKAKPGDERKIDMLMVSDTIVIWTEDTSRVSFMFLTSFVRALMAVYLRSGIPLRGAITEGALTVTKTSFTGSDTVQTNIFGSGMVEAYKLEQNQEWAGCVITKNCIDVFNSQPFELDYTPITYDFFVEQQVITKYCAPMKKGEVKEYDVINWTPFCMGDVLALSDEVIAALFAMHKKGDDQWQVKVKIDNTIKFYHDMKRKLEGN